MEQGSIDGAVRQNKAFRQRVNYWRSKGHTLEEAQRRAGVRIQILALAPEPAVQKTLLAENLRQPADRDSRRTVFLADLFRSIVCISICAGATALLVRASASYLGGGWEAWLKAGLIEAGLLYLSVYRPTDRSEFLLFRMGAVSIAVFSLFLLHSGAISAESQAQTYADYARATVSALDEDRREVLRVLDNVPETQISRRTSLLQRLDDLGRKLTVARQDAIQQPSPGNHWRVESLCRTLLIFLNVLSAHGFLAGLREFNKKENTPGVQLQLRGARTA